jgi:hypothetical protein
MPTEDKAYFQGRAEEEIEMAQSAGHPDAARSHYILAAHYLDMVHNRDASLTAQAGSSSAR